MKITQELIDFANKHTEHNENYIHKGLITGGILTGADWAYENPQWIPVDERDPVPLQSILVTLKNGHVTEVTWAPHIGYFQASSSENVPENNPVIAWMPMPLPYKPKP